MELYGIIGYPLGHSFSPAYFAQKFKKAGLDADYRKFEIPSIESFTRIIRENPSLRGLNVTIPYKQEVIPFLDELSEEAKTIGAVNCIRIRRSADGHTYLKGFNADIIGFKDSLRPLLRPSHQKALVLGTGGASKAIVHGLHQLGLSTQYVSRHAGTGLLTYADLTPQLLQDYTVVVNCTPCGMSPHTDECPDIPYTALTPRHLLYDLIYNPEETLFLKRGREQGASTKNGLDMLYGQAEASWDFWHESI